MSENENKIIKGLKEALEFAKMLTKEEKINTLAIECGFFFNGVAYVCTSNQLENYSKILAKRVIEDLK